MKVEVGSCFKKSVLGFKGAAAGQLACLAFYKLRINNSFILYF